MLTDAVTVLYTSDYTRLLVPYLSTTKLQGKSLHPQRQMNHVIGTHHDKKIPVFTYMLQDHFPFPHSIRNILHVVQHSNLVAQNQIWNTVTVLSIKYH